MKRMIWLATLLLAGLLICDTSAAQTTRPKRMLGKFEIFSTPARSGYIDTNGRVVIEEDFSHGMFRSFSGGGAAVCQERAMPKNQRWGFIDKKGKAIVRQNYSRVREFSEGLAAVAEPLTQDQLRRLRMHMGLIDWRPLSNYEWVETPDDGWCTFAYIWDAQRPADFFGPWGFVDKTGAVAIPLQFSAARGFREGLAYAAKDGVSGFINRFGQWVIKSRDNDFVGDFSEGLARFRKSQKQGCIDKKGNVVISPKFYSLGDFSNGRAAFMMEYGDYGFIDKTGEIVIEAEYRNVRPFSEGLAAVRRFSGWSWIDINGRVVIPRKYEQALGFSCGLAAVSIDGKWGYIDKKGKLVIAPRFAAASMFRDNRAKVNIGGNYRKPYRGGQIGSGDSYSIINGAWRYIDKSGEFISDLEFDEALDFRDGLAAFKIFSKCGLRNTAGKIVLPANYDDFDEKFVGGIAKVKSRGRWGFVNHSGRVVLPPVYEEVRDFYQDIAAVKVGKKWGFVDKNGEFVVKPMFDDALSFSEQRAAVKFSPTDNRKDARWGYVDTSGKTVLQPAFEKAGSFSESLAAVRVDHEFGYIDKSGKMMIQPQFQDARGFSRGLAAVRRVSLKGHGDPFWGVIDRQGNHVIPAIFPVEPKVRNGMYDFEIKEPNTGRTTKYTIDRQGIMRDGDKTLGAVVEHFLPRLLETVGKGNDQSARYALCALSEIGGPEAIEAFRKSIKSADPYKCRLGAVALGQATDKDPLDILLKQLRDAEPDLADRANEAVTLMVSDPLAAADFLGRSSIVPGAYRKRLTKRAVMAVNIGPRVPKSWRLIAGPFTFKDRGLPLVFSFIRDVADSSIYVDWRGLAELSVAPGIPINVQTPGATLARVWDDILADANTYDSRLDSIVFDGIIIVSRRDRLIAIAGAMSAPTEVGSKKPAKNRAVEKLLQVKVSRLDFNDMELSEALKFWSDVSEARIEADWKVLGQLGVKPEKTVAVNLANVTFHTVLKMTLLNAGGPGKLTYKIDDGKIHIVKASKIPAPPMPSPVAVLTGALKRSDRELRLRSAEALGNIGPAATAAIPALAEMLKDTDEKLRNAVAGAIEKIKRAPASNQRPQAEADAPLRGGLCNAIRDSH